MRRCSRCHEWKDETDFNWRDEKGQKLQYVCRACQSEQGRNRYQTKRDDIQAVNKQSKDIRVEEAQRYIYEYLSFKVCADCGEYDFSVLTFDHVRGNKRMNIADMAAHGYSLEAIKKEILLCEVVCFNCHMRRENERRSGGRFRRFWPPFSKE